MPYRQNGLYLSDRPVLHRTSSNKKVYIPDDKPPPFTTKKKLFEGGNNVTYTVKVRGLSKPMVYRVSNDGYDKQLEIDCYQEVLLTLKLSTHAICPILYGYGYDTDIQRYWFLSEKYSMSLGKFVRRNCSLRIRHIEEEMIKLFTRMIKYSFCYDIHPLNVVVSKDGIRVRLIDFDNKYCTKKRAGGHSISNTNLLVSTLIVFSNNHQGKLCGKRPYFQKILREMLDGGPARKFINGKPNLKKIEAFLNKVHAQYTGRDKQLFTARSIMRYWRGGDRDRTPVSKMIEEVLYGKMDARNYLRL